MTKKPQPASVPALFEETSPARHARGAALVIACVAAGIPALSHLMNPAQSDVMMVLAKSVGGFIVAYGILWLIVGRIHVTVRVEGDGVVMKIPLSPTQRVKWNAVDTVTAHPYGVLITFNKNQPGRNLLLPTRQAAELIRVIDLARSQKSSAIA